MIGVLIVLCGFNKRKENVWIGYSREFIRGIFTAGSILAYRACSNDYVPGAYDSRNTAARSDPDKCMRTACGKFFDSDSCGWSANSG